MHCARLLTLRQKKNEYGTFVVAIKCQQRVEKIHFKTIKAQSEETFKKLKYFMLQVYYYYVYTTFDAAISYTQIITTIVIFLFHD